MKSRKLDLAELKVDSFETLAGPDGIRGTVRAHDSVNTVDQTCNGAETCDTCPGGASDDGWCGDPNSNWWQNTCSPNYTCANHSCWYTAPNCHCNYTDGECTWGPQETCAGANPPCPV